ncbi:DUF1343 domain-containing protein [Desulfoprunum benzoelyticum]|uniref:Uncharacterized protein YbbC (DUF1343 family) n=1 Tax=Desulfoprunum benzoelyticum TaxID=1506996 RepID=A0A840UVA1_9BACT|nr:DUF1343 domain-containing protein [Desulfoprunum benzoelyticum]MBB5346648.1 uncharacterized protein YbbC (DUF1343 family) [Desulfoprunum benzoelyticum]MBM9529107.1 DUF1343 domain-containing protein [Desulfoprunum benzoelyticum]
MIDIGLEHLLAGGDRSLAGRRLGLLSNQASTDRRLRHARLLLQQRFGRGLTCLFSPQHGFFAEKQDNMVESDHAVDDETGLPLFSLYGDSRRPTPEMFERIDVLLIDLVDVGTRVYTFLYTMAYCLEEAARRGIRVVVLDRPNPTGGAAVEGNILRPECASFVGLYPLPMRHGLTFGELALLVNGEAGLGCDLEVVPMRGWQRSMRFRDTGFPWVFPSPNMPTPETALVYPGQVVWEGTNVSEGRGTTLPFELVGAPYWDCRRILAALEATPLPGCCLRPLVFEPTSGKWAQQACAGFQFHVTDAEAFRPYRTSLALLQAVFQLYPDEFHYKQPPYEYEFERLPMDLILGDAEVRRQLEAGTPVLALEEGWSRELEAFEQLRRQYFLYY